MPDDPPTYHLAPRYHEPRNGDVRMEEHAVTNLSPGQGRHHPADNSIEKPHSTPPEHFASNPSLDASGTTTGVKPGNKPARKPRTSKASKDAAKEIRAVEADGAVVKGAKVRTPKTKQSAGVGISAGSPTNDGEVKVARRKKAEGTKSKSDDVVKDTNAATEASPTRAKKARAVGGARTRTSMSLSILIFV
jgi:hypothetical protein